MLSFTLFGFGILLLVATAVTVSYAYYRSFMFHLALIVVLPVYLVPTVSRLLGGIGRSPRGIDGSIDRNWILVSILSIAVVVLFSTLVQLAIFAGPGASEGTFGVKRRRTPKRVAGSAMILLGSLGVFLAGNGMIVLLAGADRRTLDDIGAIWPGMWGASIIDWVSFAVGVVAYALARLLIRFTRAGRSLEAVSANPPLAAAFGVRSWNSEWLASGLSAFCAACAGIPIALSGAVTAQSGLRWFLIGAGAMGVVGVDLGRAFNWLPLGVGGVALATAAVTWALPDAVWADPGVLVLVLIILSFRPNGLLAVYAPPRR